MLGIGETRIVSAMITLGRRMKTVYARTALYLLLAFISFAVIQRLLS